MQSMTLDDSEDIAFLNLEDIYFLHELALRAGGRKGDLKIQDLESALGRPSNAHFYEQEDDLITLAAYLWHGISSAHGYQDANKRTALLAALTFLEANGVEVDINVSANEPGTFVDECYKNGNFEIPVLDKYLRSRCHWIEA